MQGRGLGPRLGLAIVLVEASAARLERPQIRTGVRGLAMAFCSLGRTYGDTFGASPAPVVNPTPLARDRRLAADNVRGPARVWRLAGERSATAREGRRKPSDVFGVSY